jgi:hypothetical protein
VSDRDAKELGVERRFHDKAAKLAAHSIDEAGGASLGIKSPARWIGGGDYTVSDEKGTEVAMLVLGSVSAHVVTVQGDKVGYLTIPELELSDMACEGNDGEAGCRHHAHRPGSLHCRGD